MRSESLVGRGLVPLPSDICKAWLMVEIGGVDWQVGPVIAGRVVSTGVRISLPGVDLRVGRVLDWRFWWGVVWSTLGPVDMACSKVVSTT